MEYQHPQVIRLPLPGRMSNWEPTLHYEEILI